MIDKRSDILVADDAPESCRVLAQILGGENHSVRTVSSGSEALLAVRASRPDLIILDIDMPEMDGFELCRRLTNELGMVDVPILFMSEISTLDQRARAYKCGAADYLVKPIVAAEVIARVNAQLPTMGARRMVASGVSPPTPPPEDTAADVLIVDDNPTNVKLLARALRAEGYHIRGATSGASALQAASERAPDLVLLDVTMPDMDGYETCRALQALPGASGVPVIFVSALAESLNKVQAFRAGGVDYLTKPIDLAEVRVRVATHLGIRELQMRLRSRKVELEESYARLKELEERRDELTHMLVHDMRSPVSAMLTYLELLQSDLSPDLSPQNADDLSRVRTCAVRLSKMLSEILDVSRLEAKRLPMNIERIDFRAVVESALSGLAADARTSIEWDTEAAPVFGEVDAGLLERALTNLVDNALKVSRGNKKVTLRTFRKDDRYARIEVTDEGPGIPTTRQEQIFEKFTRFGESAPHRESTGLGLAFVRLAIEAMGGEIGVISEEGKGATFWIDMPNGVPEQ